jgi:hypothetical protein
MLSDSFGFGDGVYSANGYEDDAEMGQKSRKGDKLIFNDNIEAIK